MGLPQGLMFLMSTVRFHSTSWEQHLKSRADCEVQALATGRIAFEV